MSTSSTTSVVDSARSISVWGNDSVRSMSRPTAPSTKPPTKPETIPRTAPTVTAIMVADSAMARENVMPRMSRDRTSRPVPGSMPSGWLHVIPLSGPSGIPPPSTSRYFAVLWKANGCSTPSITRNGAAMPRRM
jgi:hypothetical protein